MTITRTTQNPRQRYKTTRPAGLALVVLLLAGFVCSVAARGPSSESADPPALEEMPVPEELWDEFVRTVKDRPYFKVFKALEPETVKKAAAQWAQELGLPVEVRTQRLAYFLSELRHPIAVRHPDGGQVLAGLLTGGNRPHTRLHRPRRGSIFALEVTRREGRVALGERRVPPEDRRPVGEWPGIYSVTASQLAELEIEVVLGLRIKDPVHTFLGEFSAKDKNLLELFEMLCDMGKLGFSVRSDAVGQAAVSLRLHDVTLGQCLSYAAEAAGWEVHYRLPNDTDQDFVSDRSAGIYVSWWPSDFYSRRLRHFDSGWRSYFDSGGSLEDLPEPPIESVRKEVFRQAKKILTNRPVVVLRPMSK